MEWETLERKDHPEGCLRAVPQTPKVTEDALTPNPNVPVMLASPAMPKGGDTSPTPPWFPCFPAIEPLISGQVLPLKLVGESLREQSLSPGCKRNGFPVLKMPHIFRNHQGDNLNHTARKGHFPLEDHSLVLVETQMRLENCKAPSKLLKPMNHDKML